MSRTVVYLIASLYAGVCLATMPEGPFTAPDSAAYLEMQPLVPLGYPLFLRLAGASAAVVLQPLLFAAAVAWVGREVRLATERATVAVTAIAGILLTPDLRDYHFSILTESLFASGLLAFIAAAAAFAREPTWRRAAVAGLIAGLTTTMRRAGYAFLPVLILMVLMQRRRLHSRWPGMLMAAVFPMLATLGAESLAARSIHGDRATSLAGRHLYAKAALIDAPQPTPAPDAPRARIQEALLADYAPIRALVARAPRRLQASLIVYYETCLQGPCVERLRASLAGLPEAHKNLLLQNAAMARIGSAPGEFMALTAIHYESLWTAFKLQHPATAEAMNTFLAANRPLPFERETFKVAPADPIHFHGRPVVRIAQPLILLVGAWTFALGVYGVAAALSGRASQLGTLPAIAAMSAHGCLVVSAIGAAGISRFMVTAFPAVVVAAVVGAWWAASSAGWLRTRGPAI